MKTILTKITGTALVLSVMISSSASAGGLANAIVESEVVLTPTPPVAESAGSGGWVLPAIALLALGAIVVVANSDDDDDDDDNDDGGDVGGDGGTTPPSQGGVK